MTIRTIITKIDALKPNVFTDDQKVGWVNELFRKIEKEVYDTHVKQEGRPHRPLYVIYTDEAPGTLGIDSNIDLPDAFLDLVEFWLMGKIDLFNTDLDRYTNSMILFNNAYAEYKKWYHRNHMPKGERRIK